MSVANDFLAKLEIETNFFRLVKFESKDFIPI